MTDYPFALIQRTTAGEVVLVQYSHDPRPRELLNGALVNLLHDLDRCEHGRHEGDVCSGCNGPSKGNPLLPPDRLIGYGLDGRPIRVPERGRWIDLVTPDGDCVHE